MPGNRNLFLTGLPRSGTTLTAALVDSLSDSVCLSEPQWQSTWAQEADNPVEYVQRLCADFQRVRKILASGGEIPDRRDTHGELVLNYFPSLHGERRGEATATRLFQRPALSSDFLLGMKHNALYACVLDYLSACEGFSIVAIVRHPVATIQSWRSVDLPIRQGRLPAGERFWPEIAHAGSPQADASTISRQLNIYARFCERFLALRNRITLIRYEDILRTPAKIGELLARPYRRCATNVECRTVAVSDQQLVGQLHSYLKVHCPAILKMYPDLDCYEAGRLSF